MKFSWFWNRTTKSSYILVLLVLEQDYKVHFHERHGILSLLEQDYKVVKTNILEHETKEEKAHRVGVDDAAVDVEDGLHAVADGDAKVGVVGVRLIGQQRQVGGVVDAVGGGGAPHRRPAAEARPDRGAVDDVDDQRRRRRRRRVQFVQAARRRAQGGGARRRRRRGRRLEVDGAVARFQTADNNK